MDGDSSSFAHLPLPFVVNQRAKLPRGGQQGEREAYNKVHRAEHSDHLTNAARVAAGLWRGKRQLRERLGLPDLPASVPLLLRIEPDSSDIDYLRTAFKFEIVSEQDDGIVIIASEDTDLALFLQKVEGFARQVHGTGAAAKVYDILDAQQPDLRLDRILSEKLRRDWHLIDDRELYIVDAGIGCLGTVAVSDPPAQRQDEEDAHFQERMERWLRKYYEADDAWLNLQSERSEQIENFVREYGGRVLSNTHTAGATPFARLPDSFTVRIQIPGIGLKDLVLNYQYLFDVSEPDEMEEVLPGHAAERPSPSLSLEPPGDDAPAVCVIDSGIQEEHRLLTPAIDRSVSRCYIPYKSDTDVADYVSPGGHGTRVAGAVLYPDGVPQAGHYQLPCWIQNARVLDENCGLPDALPPPLYLEAIVARYHGSARGTKIFNHSIAGRHPFRTRHMSAWAAAMDMLSYEHDILFIQCAGNLHGRSAGPIRLGILDHIEAGRGYPDYLLEASSRMPNPSQSLQAITVGSINHAAYASGNLASLGGVDEPSAYSTSGLGIWKSIKPEVVEYGGGVVSDGGAPPSLTTPSAVCPDLVRSTLHSPGPANACDAVGTSYAAPKVAHIAAELNRLFPDEPALLYRALIINSARWPAWAENAPDKLAVLRHIGFGLPSLERATANSSYRVTVMTWGERRIKAREGHIFQIPIPEQLRAPGEEFDIRIDVTLSYAAAPRRTRRLNRGYLSTWVDWKSSNLGEDLESFKNRVLYDGIRQEVESEDVIPWIIREKDNWGVIRECRRNIGTVQKDWVVLKSHQLPIDFCIGVVGHPGWDKNPDAFARYSLVVTFEAVNQDINIYEPISLEIDNLLEQVVTDQVEVEVPVSQAMPD